MRCSSWNWIFFAAFHPFVCNRNKLRCIADCSHLFFFALNFALFVVQIRFIHHKHWNISSVFWFHSMKIRFPVAFELENVLPLFASVSTSIQSCINRYNFCIELVDSKWDEIRKRSPGKWIECETHTANECICSLDWLTDTSNATRALFAMHRSIHTKNRCSVKRQKWFPNSIGERIK